MNEIIRIQKTPWFERIRKIHLHFLVKMGPDLRDTLAIVVMIRLRDRAKCRKKE